jgi:hypothetical protein
MGLDGINQLLAREEQRDVKHELNNSDLGSGMEMFM